jgi:pyocin large subunit-like protein
MAVPSPSPLQPFADQQIWDSLKRAIAHSSGFQRWQLEHQGELEPLTLDQQVSRYLRQTLETLAY